MLHNPTNEVFECMSGGVVYIFQPKESRILLGDTATQILTNQKTPLIAVEAVAKIPEETKEEEPSNFVDYSSMKYSELRSIASAKGLFKVGMKQKDLLELLNG